MWSRVEPGLTTWQPGTRSTSTWCDFAGASRHPASTTSTVRSRGLFMEEPRTSTEQTLPVKRADVAWSRDGVAAIEKSRAEQGLTSRVIQDAIHQWITEPKSSASSVVHHRTDDIHTNSRAAPTQEQMTTEREPEP